MVESCRATSAILARRASIVIARPSHAFSAVYDRRRADIHSLDNITILPYEFSGQIEPNSLCCAMSGEDLPGATRDLLVVMMLGQRGLHIPELTDPKTPAGSRLLRYKNKAIQTLNRNLTDVATRTTEETFFSIWYFACTEVSMRDMKTFN